VCQLELARRRRYAMTLMAKSPASESWQHRFVEANGLRHLGHWVQQEAPAKVNALLARCPGGGARG
jgi:hypothetical protein